MVFEEYATFYDLFYASKHYSDEVEYIRNIINQYKPDTESILDLGCGTGKHAILLAREGYQVTGIDRSESMLNQARLNKSGLEKEYKKNLEFCRSDITALQLDTRFDVVCSLFHVISYQVSNREISETFKSVSKHLVNGGLFIFDVWYGPGVLTSKPEYRKNTYKDSNSEITRIANPEILPDKNIVKVAYKLLLEDGKNEINEDHYMRYFFTPEIEMFLDNFGMKILEIYDGYTSKKVSDNTWSAIFIATRQE